MRDTALPLFDQPDACELNEPAPRLKTTTEGRDIVEDYGNLGLSLRRHPLRFLREDLTCQRRKPCYAVSDGRDGNFIQTPGLVLVRQRPGSAKGVMFITIEDESGVANLVVWPTLYQKQRRVILGASLLGCQTTFKTDPRSASNIDPSTLYFRIGGEARSGQLAQRVAA